MKRNLTAFVLFFSALSFAQNEWLCSKTPSETIAGAWVYSVTKNQSIHLGFFEHLDYETKEKIIYALMNMERFKDSDLKTTLTHFSSSQSRITDSLKTQYQWFTDEVKNHEIRTFALESPAPRIQPRIDQSIFISEKLKTRADALDLAIDINDLLLTIFGPLILHYNQQAAPKVTLVALEDDIILQKQNQSLADYRRWSQYLNSDNSQSIIVGNKKINDFMSEANTHLVNLYQGSFNDFDRHLKMAEDFQVMLSKSDAFQDNEMTVKEAMLNALSSMMLFVKDRRARDQQFAKVLFSQNKKVISVIGTNHQTGVLYFLDELCHAK